MMVAVLVLLSFAVGFVLSGKLSHAKMERIVALAEKRSSEADATIALAESAVRKAQEALNAMTPPTEPEEVELKTKADVTINQFFTSGRYN